MVIVFKCDVAPQDRVIFDYHDLSWRFTPPNRLSGSFTPCMSIERKTFFDVEIESLHYPSLGTHLCVNVFKNGMEILKRLKGESLK